MSDEIPTLEFRNPLCPVCLEETDGDDYAYDCYDCGIRWSDEGAEPEYNIGDGQCRSTLTRASSGRSTEPETFRCQKFAGHHVYEHGNANLIMGWKPTDAGVSEVTS